MFQSFRYSPDGLGLGRWLSEDGFGEAIWVAIPLLGLLSATGLLLKVRLPLALASNLSFIYSAFFAVGVYSAVEPAAALHHLRLSAFWGPSTMLAAALLLAFPSMVSHRSYWRDIFS